MRGLAFHPAEAALLTASEDGTLKLWNLQKTVAAKKWVLGIPGGGAGVPPPPPGVDVPPFLCFLLFFWCFPSRRNAALDVEPVYAFRGHRWGLAAPRGDWDPPGRALGSPMTPSHPVLSP